VFPHAQAKFFLVATADERARRRVAELAGRGTVVDHAETLREIGERDARDAGRDVAPMKPAPDAVLIDSSTMTIDEVVDAMARACAAYSG